MKSTLSSSLKFFLICWMVLSLAAFSQAQTASKHDVIVTKNNEKIDVVIQEINASIIKYKKVNDPEGPVFTIERTEVSSVIFGNEKNQSSEEKPQVYYDEVQTPAPVTPYGKAASRKNLPIQTIHEWNSDQLRSNYKFYLSKADNYRKMATAGLIGGVMLTGAGIAVMASSNGNTYIDLGQFIGGYMIALAGLGAGIPLTIVGFVKKKSYTTKALLVQEELKRRNQPLSLQLSPGYNPALNSGYLTLKIAF